MQTRDSLATRKRDHDRPGGPRQRCPSITFVPAGARKPRREKFSIQRKSSVLVKECHA